ncbi:hypothetical protein BC835DRAFT_1431695, partial [Cytidiella melzeri]
KTLYKKATKLELDGNFDRAFQLYVKYTEEQLRLSRLSSNPAARDIHKSEAAKGLERAEKIRLKKRDLVTPVAKDHFAQGEQLHVLQQSSVVNGIRYPVWNDPASFTDGRLRLINISSIDLTNPRLSPEQISHSATWREPLYPVPDSEIPLCPEDIIQHVVSDCSLCAAIVVCIDHDRRFGSKLGKSALYPQVSEGVPTASSSKTHSLRVLFNGAYRKANVDTKLPMYMDGRLMCMSAGKKGALWPSLVEKAYMKLMGGYDFPGSCVTLSIMAATLTGWIPETIEISSSKFERERTWQRIAKAYAAGECVLTVGTGVKLPEESLLPLPLLPAHCYAVIDVIDEGDERQMTILDSWVEGSQPDLDSAVASMSLTQAEQPQEEKARSRKQNWDDVCAVFDVLLLNWNPGIFKKQLAFHGIWTRNTSMDASLPRNFHLRLSVESDEEADVWILLTRHVVDTKDRKDEYISLDVEVEHEAGISHSGLKVRRRKGAYTNNTHVLVKTRSKTSVLAVLASYDGAYDSIGCTITAFSSAVIRWAGTPSSLPYSETITGALTSKTAGGNASLPTFMINPQYYLRIHPDKSAKANRTTKSHVLIMLTGDRHVPFNVSVVWSQGQRITDMVKSDIALTTGAFKFGHASASKMLPPGDYTVIVSALEPRQTGPFSLKVDSSTRIELTPIPQEGSGMFSKLIRGSWTEDTAAGGPSFNRYMSNPVYELKLPSQSQVKIRLHLATPDSSIALNVTLFRSTPRHTLGHHVATSGPYADAVCGVVTPQMTLPSGSYFVVPSTYNPGVQAEFKLLVYTSANGAVVELTHVKGMISDA